MRLAIVGIRGLPNNYGGFETLADYLVQHLVEEMPITVYCSSRDLTGRQKKYKGARLKYLPITSHGGLGILYDSLSLIHAVFTHDKVLFLGFGAGFVMPFLKVFKRKIILNIGGLDWKRDKWSAKAQKVIRKAEELLIENCGQIISDNVGIKEYIKEVYKRDSYLIAYGGDQANKRAIDDTSRMEYPFLNGRYAFIVTRIQSDNNIEMILNAFIKAKSDLPIVMVGNWSNSDYGKRIKVDFGGEEKLILLDAIYDRDKLDILRSNCYIYIHGHSAGGTNPSLVEAMYLGLPVFAFASGYNEYTTENKAIYFRNSKELTQLIDDLNDIDLKALAVSLKDVADKNYRWKEVARKYKEVILK